MLRVLHRVFVARVSSAGLLAFSLGAMGLNSGCVSYQQYRQLEEEQERVVTANADLTKKYNQAVQQLMARDVAAKSGGGGDNEALLATIRQLKDDLSKVHATPGFTPEQIRSIPGAGDDFGGLALGEALLFSEGSADLKREAFPVLDSVLNLLKREYPTEIVHIEGHTDNQPIVRVKMRFPSNQALAYARANAVFNYFHDKGVPENRMVIHSFSYAKPTDPEKADTKEGRKENRRVVVRRGGSQI